VAEAVVDDLTNMVFGEDLAIRNISDSHLRLSMHGPKAQPAATGIDDPAARYPHDQCGGKAMHLWVEVERAADAWDRLLEVEGVKPLGWMAFNMARVEAGTPLFLVDFGPDSLPGETGILDQAVSATKGCFRGQEIVARMRDIGHPAKQIVRFAVLTDALPVAGAPVCDGPGGQTVGAVTSSTPSPLRSGRAVGLAMVKWGFHEIGTCLSVPAEGANAPIRVSEPPASFS
jgi:folate-binding protein YgfZ